MSGASYYSLNSSAGIVAVVGVIFLVMLFALLFVTASIFRIACRWAGLEQPRFWPAAGIVLAVGLINVVVGLLAVFLIVMAGAAARVDPLTLRMIAQAVGVPLGAVISGKMYAFFLKVDFGKGLLIWFYQLLVCVAVVGFFALLSFAGGLATGTFR